MQKKICGHASTKYIYAWRNNAKRQSLFGRHCRVLARGNMNSVLVEFENGQKEIISRNALRRNNAPAKMAKL